MATIRRFSAVDKAVLVSTGNSFMVCGSSTQATVNTSDLIKTDGTMTRDWTICGSSANLNILSGSTILYAELVWYSTVFSNVQGSLDLRSIQDNEITFTTPKGSFAISPQYTDTNTGISGTVDRFRGADVTSYVQDAMSGNYTVSSVPISVPSTGLSNSRGGWVLTVVYRHNSLVPQKIIYNSGIDVAAPNAPFQSTITGFTTSSDPSLLKGSFTMAVANGQPLNGDEYVLAGPSFAQLSNIGNAVLSPNPNPGTRPNNPGNSFFSGIINVADPLSASNGLLNINGTNGTNNNDGFVPSQVVGARNKWDITNVDISQTLVTDQSLIAGQITTGSLGDGIQLLTIGVQVEAKAPNITVILDSYDVDGDGEYNAEVNESIVYSITINNDGDVPANNLIVSALINSSSSFIPGTVTINGIKNENADIINGINIGTIDPRGIITILFSVKVNSVPEGGLLFQNVNYSYAFNSGLDTITNSGKSNVMQTIVQSGLLSITKSADVQSVRVNDMINYTVDIKNIGTDLAQNLFFQDKIGEGCSFVPGSVSIDGTSYEEYNPVQGFSLDNLQVNETCKIVFSSKVDSIPQSRKITNPSYISYGYMFNQYEYLRIKTAVSNTTNIIVQFTELIGQRCNNNNYPKAGDIVTYTLSLTNIGNISVDNIVVLEPPITGTSFIENSVKINGIASSGLNPFAGFTLSSGVNPQQTTKVEYQVLVENINPEHLIENTATIPFKYEITPGGSIIDSQIDSNIVDTVANYVCINAVKTVDKNYSLIGDTLYYNVNVTNNGNINATDTVFLDSLQSDLSFISGTLTINGIPYPSYDPTIGFTLGVICPDDVINVSFQAKVNTRPVPNVINNHASVVHSYKPDPNGNTFTNTILTNTVQTIINEAKYTVTKTVDKEYAQVGDALVYSTIIENIGTVNLTNMKFSDYLGAYLDFSSGSIYINGINYPNLNPSSQFPIDDMHPGDKTTITFGVIIKTNPPVGYLLNMSEVTLSYKENPNSPVITKTVYSNEVITYDPYAELNLVKSVNKLYAGIGDVLTYSFTITNDGNAAAINTFFADSIQSEASFVLGSVFVNGVSKPEFNPTEGFTIGTLEMGQVVTVQFQVIVKSVPNPNNIKNYATTSYSYYVEQSMPPISETSTSNTVTTVIASYSATLNKVVDKEYATIGDVLNYTVTAANNGTVPLINVIFKDLIPNGAEFVIGSVTVGGISFSDANPNIGFAISNVLPGGNVIVMFKVKVTSMPTSSKINNSANITFKYQLSPTSPLVDGSINSNTVTTNINAMEVKNTKSVNKSYATVPDTLTYTSVISNNGNVSIENTNFIDNVPQHLSFVQGSVKINGVTQASFNPNTGFTLGTISAGNNVTVTFDVTIDSVPPSGYVENSSEIKYEYKINPNGEYILSSVTSNTVTTNINLGSVSVTKAADRTVVKLTDVITYDFVITNTGNVLLQNVLFKDILQAESSFNAGSVYVNGVNMVSYDPNVGFTLGNIPIGEHVDVSFKITANSVPEDNVLLNNADVTYSYAVDPNGNLVTKTAASNTTSVSVNNTIISANKSVDKSIAKIGDTINFTVTLKNDGNTQAENVVFTDILDSNISFVADSVFINGDNMPGLNPNNGFNLSDIEADASTIVTFAATIISRPAKNVIYNFASINYSYTVGAEVINASIDTNTTQILVAIGELTITKAVDKNYATVKDNLAYRVVVTNTGSVNATNLTFRDIIPSSASFISGTVVVDGITQTSFNPSTGFALSDLVPNQAHTITFSVSVSSIPTSGQIDNSANVSFTYKLTESDSPVTTTTTSNTVTTYINVGNLTVTKSVDKSYATIGDVLNYTISINNTGNANCTNVFFKDIIQVNAAFVNGSVVINGVAYDSYNPNTGFTLNDIAKSESTTITFAVDVKTLPTDYYIYNNASVNYQYYINPNLAPVLVSANSNTVSTKINVGSLTASKSVNKAYATIGDTMTYTVSIFNSGNTVAKNVNFRDVIPEGMRFVSGSVTIEGISYPSYNPYNSFTLGNIISGDTVVVAFDVTITSIPNPAVAGNTASLTFSYSVNPQEADIPVEVNSNTVTTQINLGSLLLTKSVDKMYGTMGDVLTYTIVVTNNGTVRADNVTFIDNLQSDVMFNSGSVKINGETMISFNPTVGFNLGNIQPLDSVTVVFTVTISQSPAHGSVLNSAIGTFSYKIDPNGQYYSKSNVSNTVFTFIIRPGLSASKVVDKLYATLQDILNYDVLVTNSGNTTISDLFFTDTLSNGATFNNGSVIVDETSYPAYDPIVGFNLPNALVAGNTSLIKFAATVTSVPEPNKVTNDAQANGSYYIDPQGPSYQISAASNTVSTSINVGRLSNTKSVDKMYAKVNDTINYTSTITNTGNVTATNLIFTDVLNSVMTFVSGTVTINGVIYPALNPVTGFALSDLLPGQSATVSFSAKINSLPVPSYISNTSSITFSYKIDPSGALITRSVLSNSVTTNVILGEISSVKSVDKMIASLNDELTYTITLTNTGNVIDNNVFFQDTPSTGAIFKTGSVTVNGVSQPNYNPIVGFSLGDIGIGNVVVVKFTVTVASVPASNVITNQSVSTFEYLVDPKQTPFTDTSYSNTVTTNIAYGNLSVTKSVDKKYATIGEEITYTIVVKNIGNINATNVLFQDATPNNTTFVIGSVTVNGTSYPTYNPSAGFDLGIMIPGQIITVIYKVQIEDLC